MTYATLMVHIELGRCNSNLLKVANQLADRCQANIVAVAPCQSLFAVAAASSPYLSGELVAQDQDEMAREAREAETECHAVLGHLGNRLEWRSAMSSEPPADYIARAARTADLIVTAPHRGGSLFTDGRRLATGDLVMTAGRPVLVVPDTQSHLTLGTIMIAWKDSRETRRAASDALPFLELAERVIVTEVVSDSDGSGAHVRLEDVVRWLAHHGIPAEPLVKTSSDSDAGALDEVARHVRADMIVAGAYGHSRFREWMFGGVTSDMLIRPSRPVLLSH